MALRPFHYKFILPEEDCLNIPIVSPVLKTLHMWLPTTFLPYVLKTTFIFMFVLPIVVSLVAVGLYYLINWLVPDFNAYV